MRRNGILLLSMLLLVTGAWLALNRTSYAGGCQSSAWPKFLSMHINCWAVSCVGCWRYARLIQYDRCVGATGSECVCDEFLVTVRLRHFKCGSGCGALGSRTHDTPFTPMCISGSAAQSRVRAS